MAALLTENCDYVEVVAREGYTEREARFLVLAAEHSGYFVTAQFRRFLRLKPGKTSQNLMERVLDRRHATIVKTTSKKTPVLKFARRFCEMLDLPEPQKEGALSNHLRLRMQCLDFAIDFQRFEYLVREPDKVRYFVEDLGVDKMFLSKRNGRYFDERLPIFKRPQGAGFVYVDGAPLDSFDRFMDRHAGLFGSIGKAIVWFATSSRDDGRGLKTFARTIKRLKEDQDELKRLEAVPACSLGGPELRKLKRLQEDSFPANSVDKVQLGQYRLPERYGFLD